jgi:PKD repeat protein
VATGGTGTVTYAWNTQPVQTSATATNLSAGTYSVAAIDANGCLAGASVQITQPTQLTASATAQNASCNAGSDGSISGTASGGTPAYAFSWNNGALTGSNHSNLPAGTYTLLVTDANGCTATAQATIGQPAPLSVSITGMQNVSCNGLNDGSATAVASGGPGGYLYLWLPGNQTTATATGLSANTYTVYVTDNLLCDTVSATVTIQEPPPVQLSLSASPDTQACAGTVITLTASGAQNFQWAPTGETGSSIQVLLMNDITFNVTGTDANGCTGFASITLNVLPNPTAALTADPPEVCAGRPITLEASGSSTPAPGNITSVDWDLNGDNIFEITNGGFTQLANTTNPGTYTVNVLVTNNDNCKHIQSLTYTVHPVPVAAFSAAAVCDGQAVNFSNQSSITPPQTLTYLWQFGSGSGSSTQASPAFTYPGPGTYDVQLTVTSPHGCADSATLTVTVHPNPTVAFTASPQCFNVVIYKVENPETSLTYQWDLGDLNTATDTSFQHTYAQGGQYTVTLTASDNFGCEASVSQQVEVINSVPLDKVVLPNILTPNGDGLNDVLVISDNFDQCSEFEVMIFNRWGNLVYRYTHNGTPFEGK